MTHGNKGKAKGGKDSKASGKKAPAAKTGAKSSGKAGKAVKAVAKKPAAPVKKASSQPAAPKAAAVPVKGKARPAAADTGVTFTNPFVAAAFKHAVKKYPNAFRKLTD